MNKCHGCGISLQTEDETKMGYVPQEKKNEGLCQRCFKIRHYNQMSEGNVKTNQEIIESINKDETFVFFLVDLLNINEEMLESYHSLKSSKCLVLTKTDYWPKSLKKEKIAAWLKRTMSIQEEILFISTKRKESYKTLLHLLKKKKKKQAYLVGYTNVGKSTLINALKEENTVTTSTYPNTTLNFIKIKIEEITLIDTPGLQYKNRLVKNLKLYKKINPQKELKPLTYQLKKGASLLIEELIRIENKSEKANVTLYLSNELKVTKIYQKNNTLKEAFKKSEKVKKNEDLVLNAIGFINFKTETDIIIYSKEEKGIAKRESMFGEKE